MNIARLAILQAERKVSTMTRQLAKHIARRQDQTFADWFAELRELAGESWAAVADQAPTIYAVWGGGATPAQALYMV
jgi:cytochrome c biogenesis factor